LTHCLPRVDFLSLTFFTPHIFSLVEAGMNRICLALFCDVRQTRATTITGWSRAIHFLCVVRAPTNRRLGLSRYFVFSLSLSRKAGGAITTLKIKCLYFHPHSRHCVVPLRGTTGRKDGLGSCCTSQSLLDGPDIWLLLSKITVALFLISLYYPWPVESRQFHSAFLLSHGTVRNYQ
jgi:hypothetical protein